jgi:adenylate cyclase
MTARTRRRTSVLRSRPLVAIALALATCAAVLGARAAGWLVSWELGAYDTLLRLRTPLASNPPLTMVWIREEEISRYGHPLPDALLAAALREIVRFAPRAVGVDVYRDRPVGEGWDELRRVFLENPQVVIVEKLADRSHPAVGPPPFLEDRSQVGFSDVAPDRDGIPRRGILWLWDEAGQEYSSFALRLALPYLYAEGRVLGPAPENPEFVRLGETTLPPFTPDLGGYRDEDAGGYQFLLDYRRENGGFPGVALDELLAGRVDAALLRDRVVILGTASASVKDYFQTPSGLVDGDAARIFGAEYHAHAVDQLVRYGRGESRPLASLSETEESLWILAWCLLFALLGVRVRSPLSLLVSVLLGLAAILWGAGLAFAADWWIPVVPAVLGSLGALALVVAYSIQQERADRAQVMNLFGRYVSRRLAARIWEQRQLFMDGDRPRPQRITVTVMLTDLIGYTTTAETKEPAEVMDWIGVYMDRMAQQIEEHGGMVNDFLGDGIMASFGVPVPSTSDAGVTADAVNAVECALAMGEALEELNRRWREAGQPTARMRVGILTGPAVVGDIGSQDRMKYATVGNTVNTASRLESFDKEAFELEPEQSTCRVVIGQPTFERVAGRFETRCLGEHRLKGKGQPVTLYRVLARAGARSAGAGGEG